MESNFEMNRLGLRFNGIARIYFEGIIIKLTGGGSMEFLKFSKEESRLIFIICAVSALGIFINLCSGYSQWAAGSEGAATEVIESVNFPLDINTCQAAELMALKGVGPAMAAKIIAYREKNAGFKTRCEIKKVGGIGERLYEAVKDKIMVADDPSPQIDDPQEFELYENAENSQEPKIDINSASVEDFKNIKGVGAKVGEKIIEFRRNNGGRIESLKSLGAIEGIGKKRMRKLNKHFVIY